MQVSLWALTLNEIWRLCRRISSKESVNWSGFVHSNLFAQQFYESVEPDWSFWGVSAALSGRIKWGDDVCAEERRRNNHRRKCEELRGKPGFWAENLESCCAELQTSRHVTGRKTTNVCHMFSYWRIITLKYTQISIKTVLYLLHNEYSIFVFTLQVSSSITCQISLSLQFLNVWTD